MAADYQYESQLLTTIKSICYYNKEVQFYLFNRDFPKEWFIHFNKILNGIGSSIQDVKVYVDEIKDFYTYDYIQSDSTFFVIL